MRHEGVFFEGVVPEIYAVQLMIKKFFVSTSQYIKQFLIFFFALINFSLFTNPNSSPFSTNHPIRRLHNSLRPGTADFRSFSPPNLRFSSEPPFSTSSPLFHPFYPSDPSNNPRHTEHKIHRVLSTNFPKPAAHTQTIQTEKLCRLWKLAILLNINTYISLARGSFRDPPPHWKWSLTPKKNK